MTNDSKRDLERAREAIAKAKAYGILSDYDKGETA